MGDGNDIVAAKDPWLRLKNNYRVDQNHGYANPNAMVSSFFFPDSKQWDVVKVQQHFLEEDAKAILATRVPQCSSRDRVVWANCTDGIYSVKAGYRLWHALNVGTSNVPQGEGWGKIWRLVLPHKMKIFLWHLCRNTIPVRRRLSSKGVQVPFFVICATTI